MKKILFFLCSFMLLLEANPIAVFNTSKGDIDMELPDDPMMLFSMVNMKLRDCYHSLDELCDDMNVDKELLVKKLKAAGFEYSKENNKFW